MHAMAKEHHAAVSGWLNEAAAAMDLMRKQHEQVTEQVNGLRDEVCAFGCVCVGCVGGGGPAQGAAPGLTEPCMTC